MRNVTPQKRSLPVVMMMGLLSFIIMSMAFVALAAGGLLVAMGTWLMANRPSVKE